MKNVSNTEGRSTSSVRQRRFNTLRRICCISAVLAMSAFAACENNSNTPNTTLIALTGDVTITPETGVTTGTELTASYSGNEAVAYQWNKNGTAINGATETTYTPPFAGSYTVTVSAPGYISKTSAAVAVTGGTPDIPGVSMLLENPQAAQASGDPDRVYASLNRLVFGTNSRGITKTFLPVVVNDDSGANNSFAPWGNIIQDSDDVYEPIPPGPNGERRIILTAINEAGNAGGVDSRQDGLSFYFKEIDAGTNFKLSADFYVDVFGFTADRAELDGQEAFGIMARDYVPQYDNIAGKYDLTMEGLKGQKPTPAYGYNGASPSTVPGGHVTWDGVYWNAQEEASIWNAGVGGSSNMIMVGGLMRGMRVGWRTGVNDLDNTGDTGRIITDPFYGPETRFAEFDYQPKELSDYSPYGTGIVGARNRPDFPSAGLTYRLHLEKTDAGFKAKIEPPQGTNKTGVEYNSFELPSPTNMLTGPGAIKKDKYYVGFFAARDAKVTVTNIQYEESPSAIPPVIGDGTVYQVSIADGIQNGSITAIPASSTAGEFVGLHIIPRINYRLKPGTLSVRQTNGTAVTVVTVLGNYYFFMPASNVTVSGEFEDVRPFVLVPGSDGKTIVESNLNTNYNGGPGSPGMRVFPLSRYAIDYNSVTSPVTLGLWPQDNKFHIMGMPTGGYMNAGFDDALFLYYDKPFAPGETFRFSARVRITTVHAVSTGKGVHVGAYSPNYYPYSDEYGISPGSGLTPEIDETGESQVFSGGSGSGSKGVGLFLRAEATPQFRLYYSIYPVSTVAGTSAASGVTLSNSPEINPTTITLSQLQVGKEYIYEVTRAILPVNTSLGSNAAQQVIEYKMAYGFRLLDAKTYLPVAFNANSVIGSLTPTHVADHGANPGSGYLVTLPVDSEFHPFGMLQEQIIHPALREQNVFAGVCIPGANVEVSQIKVWHNGDAQWNYKATLNPDGTFTGSGDTPDFATPDTTPQYVPANTFAIQLEGRSLVLGVSDDYYLKQPFLPEDERGWAYDNFLFLEEPFLVDTAFQPRLTMTRIPSFANANIWYEFYKVDGHPAITIQGEDPAELKPENQGNPALAGKVTYKRGRLIIDPDALTSGVKATARFKVVARDLNLDVEGPEGKGAPDYSQKQTLPEYYFRVTITRP